MSSTEDLIAALKAEGHVIHKHAPQHGPELHIKTQAGTHFSRAGTKRCLSCNLFVARDECGVTEDEVCAEAAVTAMWPCRFHKGERPLRVVAEIPVDEEQVLAPMPERA